MSKNSMEYLLNQLINIWEESESYSKSDVLEILQELGEKITSQGKSLGNDTVRYIEELRLELILCPQCGSELTTKDEIVNVGEARGCPYSEINQCRICPVCHWKEEN